MATYAIGDIHGCFKTFTRLLARIRFDRRCDRLWFVGDLINRGTQNLEMVRWAIEHDSNVIAVLGNHELHLLGVEAGLRARAKSDTFDDILQASDRDDLVQWIRERPLIHHESEWLMVHAGLHPRWSLQEAIAHAHALTKLLSEPHGLEVLLRDDATHDVTVLRDALAVMTRLRACTIDGEMLRFAGPLDEIPSGNFAWFLVPQRRSLEGSATIVFGHWAALGLYRGDRVMGIDTGCVWGNQLTAFRIDDQLLFHEPSEVA